ncbi:MAG: toll/interleukin-1 receptor domain-containing protein [Leptolyngbyaceae cyanobacterium MO_188.B28]|nr:toll/interleukin-1 receptor domain-containing protein [Leptolyngbyaceae cyanobacterium MO_188.B28]
MSNPGSIFISYRRSDSIGDTGRIYDYLEGHFGRDRVFKDVDSIPLGVTYREYLEQEVGRCQVLVAVIGPTWLTVSGEDGHRRLDSPTDFVRLEIESALKLRIPVIPLLVNGATMPSSVELPEALRTLPDWQASVIRHDPDFRRDVNKLIQGIESLVGQIQSHQATHVHSASNSRFSESSQRNGTKTRKEIPWIYLAAIFGLYGLQGYCINGAGAWAWAWTEASNAGGAASVALVWAEAMAMTVSLFGAGVVAVAVAWIGARAGVVFIVLALTWIVAGTGAVAVTVARAGAGVWTMAKTMIGIGVAAGFVTWLGAGVVAVALAMTWVVTGRKLKGRFSSAQVFWILGVTAIAGLGVGTLKGW